MTHHPTNPLEWATRIRSLGNPLHPEPGEDPASFIHAFRDELDNRRAVDTPLIARALGVPLPTRGDGLSPDEALWWALLDPTITVDAQLALNGPRLIEGSASLPIEIATQAELSALHALWWHARRRPELRERVGAAIDWHMDELQPDNATNLPWAAHVFIERWCERGQFEAVLHAQQLIHNCRVQLGRPDAFSLWVLDDAARALESLADDQTV